MQKYGINKRIDFVDKFNWIENHPALELPGGYMAVVEFRPYKGIPGSQAISISNPEENTEIRWLVDFGDHHRELYANGSTAEEAIENLYKIVLDEYGDY